jgi:hypothetical protein
MNNLVNRGQAFGFHLYTYHHDDTLFGWKDLQSTFGVDDSNARARRRSPGWRGGIPYDEIANVDQLHRMLSEAFSKIGWEQDGGIDYCFVPPFFNVDDRGATCWFPVFHVKQSNNGTSFIASEYPLNARRP